jgi:hypothetical protein
MIIRGTPDKETMMLCKRCKEAIEVGDACRCEPAEAGSNKHVFYHCECWYKVKEERQREKERAFPDYPERR